MRAKLTTKQAEMLACYGIDGEPADLLDYAGRLGWYNRERVIDTLHRKGLLDRDGVTVAGFQAIGDHEGARRRAMLDGPDPDEAREDAYERAWDEAREREQERGQ